MLRERVHGKVMARYEKLETKTIGNRVNNNSLRIMMRTTELQNGHHGQFYVHNRLEGKFSRCTTCDTRSPRPQTPALRTKQLPCLANSRSS